MSDVVRLEKELAEAKKKELKQKWEVYLDKIKAFCKSLVGRVIVAHTANGRFYMYKVTGYKEQYYGDRQGAYGQWGPERWIELQTEGYLSYSVADDRGRWWRPGISSFDYNSHKFVFKKGTKVEIAKFDFTEGNISDFGYGGNDQRVYKIGYTEYDQYKEDPNYDRALSDLLTFAQIMPDDSVYEEGKKIYLTHVQQVKDFWIKNEPKFKNLDRLSTIYEKAKGS